MTNISRFPTSITVTESSVRLRDLGDVKPTNKLRKKRRFLGETWIPVYLFYLKHASITAGCRVSLEITKYLTCINLLIGMKGGIRSVSLPCPGGVLGYISYGEVRMRYKTPRECEIFQASDFIHSSCICHKTLGRLQSFFKVERNICLFRKTKNGNILSSPKSKGQKKSTRKFQTQKRSSHVPVTNIPESPPPPPGLPCTRVFVIYSISMSDYSSAQSIPSEKSFLFSLKPFRENYGSTKFSLSPGKGGEAIRGDKDRGPCWGIATREMCFSPRDVKINPNGVFSDSGITGLGSFFTGQPSFQADDVEVLIIEGKIRNHSHHHHCHHYHHHHQ